jgi:formylglycine-generating enzyme required for sulfatase activity
VRWVLWVLAATVVLAAGMGQAQPAQKRVALIIAIANYAGYPVLLNTATDAGLVRETLTRAGFGTVEVRSDVGLVAFREALTRFRSAAAGADVALVYYAGHAVEVAGRNWLIPRDAALASDANLPAQAVDAVDVFTAMTGAKTRIVVLDACRENPFEARLRASGARGVARGLGAPTAASGLADLTRAGDSAQGALLMYSAAPGRVAEDGVAGQGSPFARAFAGHFAEPDVELRVAVGKISDAVAAETGNRQLPFSTLSLSGVPIVMLRNEDRPVPPAPTTPGAEFRDCPECPLMVVVPAGRFLMGSPESEWERDRNEGLQRRVTIAHQFAVGRFEVTFAQWDACVVAGGCAPPDEEPWRPDDRGWGRDTRPVINVSWQDAKRYVSFLNGRIGGKAYRLLTEAEWEYAARAGTTTAFSTGATIAPTQAQYVHSRGYGRSPVLAQAPGRTAPVGSFPANAFKLHDMHGNVFEWVEDCYVAGDAANTARGCSSRVIRGGSYSLSPSHLRSAARSGYTPSARYEFIGFRVARTL